MHHIKKLVKSIFISITFMFITLCAYTECAYADQDVISLFPIENYDQTISTWIKPNDPHYDKSLLTQEMQQKRLDIFYDHYFGSLSPWNAEYVTTVLKQSSPNDLKSIEINLLDYFNNTGKSHDEIGYGENFRPHDINWIKKIETNVNISQFNDLTYHADQRGIAIENLSARALPTDDVYFYNHKIAGEGYPFDILQISALWAGTPVYIVGETRDHAWLLVITPDYIGWVKSRGIARTDNYFVDSWSSAAKHKLVAITQTKTSIVDDKNKFLFSAYVGAVFPGITDANSIKIMVPIADTTHHAVIEYGIVSNENAAVMPLSATPHHFATIMSTMINRPYGWGGIYFYNDCSAELKSLFTPFGIWLPRHSSNQVTAGKMVDLSSSPAKKRLSYLMNNGQPFLTIIYIGGHVFLYIGNDFNPKEPNTLMAMTYQNMWGLSPNPRVRRAVIGQSVLFPLLLSYPEDTSLTSLADKKYFQIAYLNQLPDSGSLLNEKIINIRSLMYPEILIHAGLLLIQRPL